MFMRFRSCPRRRLALLTLLCGAFTSSFAAADPQLLSPDVPSAILIDEGLISEQICQRSSGDDQEESGHTAKCRVVMKNNTDETRPGLEILEAVETVCGSWHGRVVFGSPSIRPGSHLAWTAAAGDPSRGLFAGAFEMTANLHLVHDGTGQTADVILPVRFNLAGPWTFAASGEPIMLIGHMGYEEGDEVIFDQCIPQDFESTYDYEVLEGNCEICLRFCDFPLLPSTPSGLK